MMHKRKFLGLIVLFAFASFYTLYAGGYKIKVKINHLSNTEVMLAHYMGKNIYPDDTAYLDQSGEGVFEGDEPLTGGMYIVYLPNKKYFDLLIGDDQKFSIKNDTSDLLDNLSVSGSEINQAFIEHQKFLRNKRNERKELQKTLDDLKTKRKKKKIKEEMIRINEEVKEHTNKMIEEYSGTFLAVFLKALEEIDVPDPPKDEEGNIDSTFQYRYYKDHYFDHFDIGNPRLLRTPIYEQKIMKYMKYVTPQIPDSLIVAVDTLISMARADKETFRFVLIKLFNHFAGSKILGMDAVYVHIAENYYIPEAEWSDPDFIKKLKKNVKEMKPLLIGKKAPDIEMIEISTEHFIRARDDTALITNPYVFKRKLNLYDIDAKYIILYFWERDCGHCREYTPKLYEIYQDFEEEDVEMISFNMIMGKEGKKKWIEFINEHELYDWINAWNPFSYEFKKEYNIKATPALFLLDEDKKIVAKKLAPEQVREVLDNLIHGKKKPIIQKSEMETTQQ
ncbi:MAG: thioredoxin-like domain-containing protein [Bacteroidota bacterium]